MALTAAQLTTFKNAIIANSSLTADRTAGNHGVIADFYNAVGTGFLWRPTIMLKELNTAIVWTEFIALTVAAQNAYIAMIQAGYVDSTSTNIRNGFGAIFTGTSLANLTAIAKKIPTVFELLFTTSNVCSLFGYTVTVDDVLAALRS